MNNNQWLSKVAVWMVVALVLFTVFNQFDRPAPAGTTIGYSDFLNEVRAGRIGSCCCGVSPRSSPGLISGHKSR